MNPTDSSADHPADSPLSEADIQAYADGTLSPARAAFLRDYLVRDPAEARRVAFYGKLNEQIQRSFQSADDSSATIQGARGRSAPSARARMGKPLNVFRALRVLAMLAIALIAGSGWLAGTQVTAQALDNAAMMALAQAGAAPFSATSPTRTDPSAPNLAAIGLRLVDQRVISLGVLQRASEYVYLNRDNQPVVVLSSLALLARAEPQWSARRIGEVRLLGWTARRQRFVVAGNARTHGLMRAADVMTMR
ncbi:transcriptional regulator [Paraburkholderia sp. MPAMCS5]|uniref:anti-sigma factor family protein n=1 Tax=Paraburkholderia sp. MPAMCS5 TaxID=3112563 RepID=UPI002E196D58|nr:transcriptional regulator [Paraburkholderia sp. MPAMCS5]